MRKAFTMVELIFVMVIIGIIAAIAIPKLNATRDDATISTIVANTRTMVADVQKFYTAKGSEEWQAAKITEVTNIPLYTDDVCTQPVTTSTEATAETFYICDKQGTGAINVVTFETTDAGSITVTTKSGSIVADAVSADKAMLGLANTATIGKTHILGGTAVFH